MKSAAYMGNDGRSPAGKWFTGVRTEHFHFFLINGGIVSGHRSPYTAVLNDISCIRIEQLEGIQTGIPPALVVILLNELIISDLFSLAMSCEIV